MKEGERTRGGLTNLTNVRSCDVCCWTDGWFVCCLCPSLSFPLASKVVVIVVCLLVFSRDSVVKCTFDAVLGIGVGGHITLCIPRAGVEVIALVLPLMGAVGIRKTQFPYLGRNRSFSIYESTFLLH